VARRCGPQPTSLQRAPQPLRRRISATTLEELFAGLDAIPDVE
jgi:hypothetical protein